MLRKSCLDFNELNSIHKKTSTDCQIKWLTFLFLSDFHVGILAERHLLKNTLKGAIFKNKRIWLWNRTEITSADHHCHLLGVILELNCLSDVSSTQHYLPIGKLWTCTYINAINVNVYSLRSEARDERI